MSDDSAVGDLVFVISSECAALGWACDFLGGAEAATTELIKNKTAAIKLQKPYFKYLYH